MDCVNANLHYLFGAAAAYKIEFDAVMSEQFACTYVYMLAACSI